MSDQEEILKSIIRAAMRVGLRAGLREDEQRDLAQKVALLYLRQERERTGSSSPAVENPEAWAKTVAKRRVIDLIRAAVRARTQSRERAGAASLAEQSNATDGSRRLAFVTCLLAFDELEPPDQQLLRLKYVEDQSYEAISKALGMEQRVTVRKLARARALFNQAWRRLQ